MEVIFLKKGLARRHTKFLVSDFETIIPPKLKPLPPTAVYAEWAAEGEPPKVLRDEARIIIVLDFPADAQIVMGYASEEEAEQVLRAINSLSETQQRSLIYDLTARFLALRDHSLPVRSTITTDKSGAHFIDWEDKDFIFLIEPVKFKFQVLGRVLDLLLDHKMSDLLEKEKRLEFTAVILPALGAVLPDTSERCFKDDVLSCRVVDLINSIEKEVKEITRIPDYKRVRDWLENIDLAFASVLGWLLFQSETLEKGGNNDEES